MLLDGHGLAYRAFYAFLDRPLRTSRGENTSVPWGVTRLFRKLVADHAPTHAAFVFDAGKSFRGELYPGYKATRDKLADAQADELTSSMRRLRQILEALRVPAVEVPGYEADDVIGTLAARATRRGFDVAIVSGDTDFYQLIGPHVAVIEPGRGGRSFIEARWIDGNAATERIGVPPAQVVDYLGLVGDRSDGVPGVRGIGPKTAIQLIGSFGSLDAALARAGEVRQKRAREGLVTGAGDARLSRQLVTIRTDVPVSVEPDALAVRAPDRERLRDVFVELEFHTLLRELAPEGAEPDAYEVARGQVAAARAAKRARAGGRVGLAVIAPPGSSRGSAPLGIALAPAPGEATYVPLEAGGEIPTAVRELLAAKDVQKVGHDLKPALLSLRAAGSSLDGPLVDVMLAAYCLDPSRRQYDIEALAVEQLGYRMRSGSDSGPLFERRPAELANIAGERADTAIRLVDRLLPALGKSGQRRLLDDIEMPLVPVLADMEWEGIGIDEGLLESIGRELETSIAGARRRALAAAGRDELNLDSPVQLRQVLFQELGLRVIKRTKTGPSTDADVLAELSAEHPFPARVLAYRELAVLKSTFVDGLRAKVDSHTGRLHTSFHQAVAITGRLSSSEPNLQNIPVRTQLGARLREAFTAGPGRLLLTADYSQIELRVFAHLARDPAFVEAFRMGEDIHAQTAARVFDVPADGVTPRMRETAKMVNYATLYGQGARALARRLDIGEDEAAAFHADYFSRFGHVRAYLERQIRLARERGFVETIFGRRRYVPELRSSAPRVHNFGERVARNTPIQGSAADLIKLAMIRIHARLRAERVPCRMLLQVHDELLFEVDRHAAGDAGALIALEMERVADLSVPLAVDLGTGKTWYETKTGTAAHAPEAAPLSDLSPDFEPPRADL